MSWEREAVKDSIVREKSYAFALRVIGLARKPTTG